MSKDLTYKLSVAQIAPPAHCWKLIEERLDNEYHLSDIHLSNRLTETEITPPVLAWQNIQPYLTDRSLQPARIIPLSFKRIAVAAALLGVIAFAGWYAFQNNADSGTQNTIAVTNAVGSVISPKKAEEKTLSERTGKQESKNSIVPETSKYATQEKIVTETPKRRSPSRRLGPAKVNSISPVQQISIQAPPIRDADGNIIMDLNLLRSSENEHYITVTGPNGQQTRISEKFLDMIHYLNAEETDYFPDSPERRKWKARIKEWRNKLLEQAGYFPAHNYMGIMDLKELIQDK